MFQPTNDGIKKWVEIYDKSVNYSGHQILKDITFRGDESKLSEFAKKKLPELESHSKITTHHIRKFRPKGNNSKNQKHRQTINDKLIGYGIFGMLVIVLILILVRFITVIDWVF
nr:DUF6584 family protein [Psychroserpens burtonensis]